MKPTVNISNEEHIAFLLFWLHHSFLCEKSTHININYFTLANLLHEGNSVCLRKIPLSSWYESLGTTYKSLKNLSSILTNMVGPLWLLHLWLNMIYTPCFATPSRATGSRTPYGVYLVPITRHIHREYYISSF